MATGEDANGKTPKNPANLLPAFLEKTNISQEDKLRLLILYIISQEGITDSIREQLSKKANLSDEDQICVGNLRYLGVSLEKVNLFLFLHAHFF